jgi:hypothetical protein
MPQEETPEPRDEGRVSALAYGALGADSPHAQPSAVAPKIPIFINVSKAATFHSVLHLSVLSGVK